MESAGTAGHQHRYKELPRDTAFAAALAGRKGLTGIPETGSLSPLAAGGRRQGLTARSGHGAGGGHRTFVTLHNITSPGATVSACCPLYLLLARWVRTGIPRQTHLARAN